MKPPRRHIQRRDFAKPALGKANPPQVTGWRSWLLSKWAALAAALAAIAGFLGNSDKVQAFVVGHGAATYHLAWSAALRSPPIREWLGRKQLERTYRGRACSLHDTIGVDLDGDGYATDLAVRLTSAANGCEDAQLADASIAFYRHAGLGYAFVTDTSPGDVPAPVVDPQGPFMLVSNGGDNPDWSVLRWTPLGMRFLGHHRATVPGSGELDYMGDQADSFDRSFDGKCLSIRALRSGRYCTTDKAQGSAWIASNEILIDATKLESAGLVDGRLKLNVPVGPLDRVVVPAYCVGGEGLEAVPDVEPALRLSGSVSVLHCYPTDHLPVLLSLTAGG